MRNDDIGALFRNPSTPASVLLFLLIDTDGLEFLNWEPETLDREIWSEWKVTPPQDNKDKIWALVTVMTTNLFYQDLNCFIHVCNALADNGADFSSWDPASVSDMAWAIAEVSLIDPPDEKDTSYQFSPEIVAYMSAELDREGFSKPPRILARYVKPIEDEARLNDVLEGDGIEYRTYWVDQENKRIDVDRYVGEKLLVLLKTLSTLPLRHADPERLKELEERGNTILAKRSTQQEGALESSVSRTQL